MYGISHDSGHDIYTTFTRHFRNNQNVSALHNTFFFFFELIDRQKSTG